MRENAISDRWVPINYLKRQIKIGSSFTNIRLILRKMIPIKIAEAITIHKSQGSTYSEVIVHRPERLPLKLLYVACSRVTSLNGLYFTDVKNKFDISKLRYKDDDQGRKKIEQLETEKQLQFDLHFLQDFPSEYDTFIFSNIQSLNKYFELVKADKCFLSAKFIFLVETWSLESDQYEIDNYHCIYRHDCIGTQRRPHGIIVYVKNYSDTPINIEIIYEDHIYNPLKKHSHNIVAFSALDYCFCILYREKYLRNTCLKIYLII